MHKQKITSACTHPTDFILMQTHGLRDNGSTQCMEKCKVYIKWFLGSSKWTFSLCRDLSDPSGWKGYLDGHIPAQSDSMKDYGFHPTFFLCQFKFAKNWLFRCDGCCKHLASQKFRVFLTTFPQPLLEVFQSSLRQHYCSLCRSWKE